MGSDSQKCNPAPTPWWWVETDRGTQSATGHPYSVHHPLPPSPQAVPRAAHIDGACHEVAKGVSEGAPLDGAVGGPSVQLLHARVAGHNLVIWMTNWGVIGWAGGLVVEGGGRGDRGWGGDKGPVMRTTEALGCEVGATETDDSTRRCTEGVRQCRRSRRAGRKLGMGGVGERLPQRPLPTDSHRRVCTEGCSGDLRQLATHRHCRPGGWASPLRTHRPS